MLHFLPLCAIFQGLSVPYQFLEYRNQQSCMHAALRTEIVGKSTCLDSIQLLPSVTLFSDLLLKGLSILLQLMEFHS